MNFTTNSSISTNITSDYEYPEYDFDQLDYSSVFGEDGQVQKTILDDLVKLLPCLKELGINIDSIPASAMGFMETFMNNSWKFVRMSDDLHALTKYLNDIRICFIVVTISSYIGVLLYLLVLCVRKTSSSTRRRNRQSDYETSPPRWELESIKTDGYSPTGGANFAQKPAMVAPPTNLGFRQHRMTTLAANQHLLDSNGGQNQPLLAHHGSSLGHPRRTMMAQLSMDHSGVISTSPLPTSPTDNSSLQEEPDRGVV